MSDHLNPTADLAFRDTIDKLLVRVLTDGGSELVSARNVLVSKLNARGIDPKVHVCLQIALGPHRDLDLYRSMSAIRARHKGEIDAIDARFVEYRDERDRQVTKLENALGREKRRNAKLERSWAVERAELQDELAALKRAPQGSLAADSHRQALAAAI